MVNKKKKKNKKLTLSIIIPSEDLVINLSLFKSVCTVLSIKFGAKFKDLQVKLATHSLETRLITELIKYTYGTVKFSRTKIFNKSELSNFSKIRALKFESSDLLNILVLENFTVP